MKRPCNTLCQSKRQRITRLLMVLTGMLYINVSPCCTLATDTACQWYFNFKKRNGKRKQSWQRNCKKGQAQRHGQLPGLAGSRQKDRRGGIGGAGSQGMREGGSQRKG